MNNPLVYIRVPVPVWVQSPGRYGNNRWEGFSWRLRRTVHLNSDLEYDFWILIESNPEYVAFCEQPLRIRVRVGNKNVTSIFDMWTLTWEGAECYWEVKYEEKLRGRSDDPRLDAQLSAQEIYCNAAEEEYRVITDREIRANPLILDNWKQITRQLARTQSLDLAALEESVLHFIRDEGHVRLGYIEDRFPSEHPGRALAATFRLLHRGTLRAPLEREPLSPNTVFSTKEGW